MITAFPHFTRWTALLSKAHHTRREHSSAGLGEEGSTSKSHYFRPTPREFSSALRKLPALDPPIYTQLRNQIATPDPRSAAPRPALGAMSAERPCLSPAPQPGGRRSPRRPRSCPVAGPGPGPRGARPPPALGAGHRRGTTPGSISPRGARFLLLRCQPGRAAGARGHRELGSPGRTQVPLKGPGPGAASPQGPEAQPQPGPGPTRRAGGAQARGPAGGDGGGRRPGGTR